MRSKRKLEHIDCSLLLFNQKKPQDDCQDIRFIPVELPERDLSSIDLSVKVAKQIIFHNFLYINASTGGTKETFPLLFDLAMLADSYNLALAVGSQTSMFEENTMNAYRKLRAKHPKLRLIANTSANHPIEKVKQMIETLNADMIQVHLNLAQEAVMPEGDRNFCNYLSNLENYSSNIKVPVIIKGVGYGISKETYDKIKHFNFSVIDVGGHGGTNFVHIENYRRNNQITGIDNWGLSVFESLLEMLHFCDNTKFEVWASGGVYNALTAIQCLSLGANAIGILSPILSLIKEKKYNILDSYIENYLEHSKIILRMLGCQNIKQLRDKSIIISGTVGEYCRLRQIDIEKYANRLG